MADLRPFSSHIVDIDEWKEHRHALCEIPHLPAEIVSRLRGCIPHHDDGQIVEESSGEARALLQQSACEIPDSSHILRFAGSDCPSRLFIEFMHFQHSLQLSEIFRYL